MEIMKKIVLNKKICSVKKDSPEAEVFNKIKNKKIRNACFEGMGEIGEEYYFTGIKRRYGYDVLDKNFKIEFSLGNKEFIKELFESSEKVKFSFFEMIKCYFSYAKTIVKQECGYFKNKKKNEKIFFERMNSYDVLLIRFNSKLDKIYNIINEIDADADIDKITQLLREFDNKTESLKLKMIQIVGGDNFRPGSVKFSSGLERGEKDEILYNLFIQLDKNSTLISAQNLLKYFHDFGYEDCLESIQINRVMFYNKNENYGK